MATSPTKDPEWDHIVSLMRAYNIDGVIWNQGTLRLWHLTRDKCPICETINFSNPFWSHPQIIKNIIVSNNLCKNCLKVEKGRKFVKEIIYQNI